MSFTYQRPVNKQFAKPVALFYAGNRFLRNVNHRIHYLSAAIGELVEIIAIDLYHSSRTFSVRDVNFASSISLPDWPDNVASATYNNSSAIGGNYDPGSVFPDWSGSFPRSVSVPVVVGFFAALGLRSPTVGEARLVGAKVLPLHFLSKKVDF